MTLHNTKNGTSFKPLLLCNAEKILALRSLVFSIAFLFAAGSVDAFAQGPSRKSNSRSSSNGVSADRAVPSGMRPSSSTTTSSNGFSRYSSRRNQGALPPYVPNGMFSFTGSPSEDCPVLLQIVDDEEFTVRKKSRSSAQSSKGKEIVSLGEARLNWLVSGFDSPVVRGNVATWVGSLASDYKGCTAQGFLQSRNGRVFTADSSFLFVEMSNGSLKLHIDAGRLENGKLIQARLEDGQPKWKWTGAFRKK